MSALALLLTLTAAPATAQDVPPVAHAPRLDEVGVAGTMAGGAGVRLAARHRTLPSGSFAEVTALDTGRTIVALVERDQALPPSTIVLLSDAATAALGIGGGGMPAVRIRPAAPSPAEQASVRAGSVVSRLDAPPALLAALRRRLPEATRPSPAPVAAPAPKPLPPTRTTPPAPVRAPVRPPAGRWFVQVAALSDAARAAALAKSVDGVVRSAGRLYRVQAGPFATRAAAEAARAALARRGFGDARIIAQD